MIVTQPLAAIPEQRDAPHGVPELLAQHPDVRQAPLDLGEAQERQAEETVELLVLRRDHAVGRHHANSTPQRMHAHAVDIVRASPPRDPTAVTSP